MDYQEKSAALHRSAKGKIEIISKVPITNREDLSLAYTPGVAGPCLLIKDAPEEAFALTATKSMVAVISDGSAVLGLGNIGPLAALPVMEGKCALFKRFADISAFPIVLSTQDTEEIVATIKAIAPTFGGINLEDIAAPRCFEIEERLKAELDIPVMHDDQHGTAIVVLAGLINALKVTGKTKESVTVVVNGAGAAGVAITKLLLHFGVANIILCDSKGIVHKDRTDLTPEKQNLLNSINKEQKRGALREALVDADVFIGVSKAGVLSSDDVKRMKEGAIIFAMANPTPEIMPEDAQRGGALIIATGRSDFPNQINNSLVFPGVFKGALEHRVKRITDDMKVRAAESLALVVTEPTAEKIIPGPFDEGVVEAVSSAIYE